MFVHQFSLKRKSQLQPLQVQGPWPSWLVKIPKQRKHKLQKCRWKKN